MSPPPANGPRKRHSALSDTPGRRRKRRRARARGAPQARHRRLPRPRGRRRARGGRVQQRPRDPARLRPERPPACVDRRQLVHLRRRRLSARLDPGREEPSAREPGGDEPVDGQGDGRDRGPPLLPARRHRLPGHCPRRRQGHPGGASGRGRLDDHAAARPQPLHQAQRADPAAEGRRGMPRRQAEQAPLAELDPRELHEHRLLREPRLRRRGRGADLLLAPRQEALAAPGGPARRAPPGAVGVRPVQEPGARDRAPQPRPRGALRER